MEETITQEHTFVLERAPGVGYGIAISGGRDNPGVHTGDRSIVISDVVPRGPASDKLKLVKLKRTNVFFLSIIVQANCSLL